MLIISSLFGISVFSGCTNKPKELKIMTWNIWHGGIHGKAENKFKEDSANTINTLKVIQQNDPDILFMQETYCCGMEIAKKAGFKYSWRGSSNLSIHSKYPIIDTINIFKPFNSHGVKIKFYVREILCFNIWLNYLPDYFNNSKSHSVDSLISAEKKTRNYEIQSILAELDQLTNSDQQVPIIIGGDFNSGSHLDWIESTKKSHYNQVVEWPVSLEMQKNGFIDSYREKNKDPLVKVGATWGGFDVDDFLADRIDYIYYKGENIKSINSRVISEDPPGGFFNSDHRSVLSVFEVK